MKKLSLLLVLGLLACEFGDKAQDNKSREEEPAFQGTSVEYEIATVEEEGGPCKDDEGKGCVEVSISYPSILKGAASEVLDSLNRNIQSTILEYAFISEKPDNFESLITEIQKEYESVNKDFPNYNTPWQLEVSADIIYQDSLFISVASTIYSFTGGAHPNQYQVYRSYDLISGKALTLSDLLEKGFELDLNEAAELEFRMAKQIPPSRDLDDEGYFFEGNRFKLNSNFAIMNKSLLFYFNPYEIGPYALGATELELKLTDYVKLIKDGSVIEDLKN
ncbi:MAG: DUF3298 and DUF4163 domain-containing protein [Roseivirga sp.]